MIKQTKTENDNAVLKRQNAANREKTPAHLSRSTSRDDAPPMAEDVDVLQGRIDRLSALIESLPSGASREQYRIVVREIYRIARGLS